MLTIKMEDGSLRTIEELGCINWKWLSNGDCEYTFEDGLKGIVLKEKDVPKEIMARWLK